MTDLTKPAADSPGVDEFLGTKPVPRWRRWMKFWLPALILIVVVLGIAQCTAEAPGPDYITEPVTQASLALSRAMVEKGPYVRYVWTLAQHASPARWPGDPILRTEPRADLSDLWLRAERQVTLPLPRAGASLFLIRVLLEPLVQAAADVSRRDRLVASLRSMSESVVAYKHIAEARERVLAAWG